MELFGIFGSTKRTSNMEDSLFDNNYVEPDALDDEFLKELNSESGMDFKKLQDERGAFAKNNKLDNISRAQAFIKKKAMEKSPDGSVEIKTKLGKNAHFVYYLIPGILILLVGIGIIVSKCIR